MTKRQTQNWVRKKQARADRIPEIEWKRHKAKLCDLYERHTLKTVMEIMKRDHGFDPTERQLNYKFERWDRSKYGKKFPGHRAKREPSSTQPGEFPDPFAAEPTSEPSWDDLGWDDNWMDALFDGSESFPRDQLNCPNEAMTPNHLEMSLEDEPDLADPVDDLDFTSTTPRNHLDCQGIKENTQIQNIMDCDYFRDDRVFYPGRESPNHREDLDLKESQGFREIPWELNHLDFGKELKPRPDLESLDEPKVIPKEFSPDTAVTEMTWPDIGILDGSYLKASPPDSPETLKTEQSTPRPTSDLLGLADFNDSSNAFSTPIQWEKVHDSVKIQLAADFYLAIQDLRPAFDLLTHLCNIHLENARVQDIRSLEVLMTSCVRCVYDDKTAQTASNLIERYHLSRAGQSSHPIVLDMLQGLVAYRTSGSKTSSYVSQIQQRVLRHCLDNQRTGADPADFVVVDFLTLGLPFEPEACTWPYDLVSGTFGVNGLTETAHGQAFGSENESELCFERSNSHFSTCSTSSSSSSSSYGSSTCTDATWKNMNTLSSPEYFSPPGNSPRFQRACIARRNSPLRSCMMWTKQQLEGGDPTILQGHDLSQADSSLVVGNRGCLLHGLWHALAWRTLQDNAPPWSTECKVAYGISATEILANLSRIIGEDDVIGVESRSPQDSIDALHRARKIVTGLSELDESELRERFLEMFIRTSRSSDSKPRDPTLTAQLRAFVAGVLSFPHSSMPCFKTPSYGAIDMSSSLDRGIDFGYQVGLSDYELAKDSNFGGFTGLATGLDALGCALPAGIPSNTDLQCPSSQGFFQSIGWPSFLAGGGESSGDNTSSGSSGISLLSLGNPGSFAHAPFSAFMG